MIQIVKITDNGEVIGIPVKEEKKVATKVITPAMQTSPATQTTSRKAPVFLEPVKWWDGTR
jgi:hypothetical protein